MKAKPPLVATQADRTTDFVILPKVALLEHIRSVEALEACKTIGELQRVSDQGVHDIPGPGPEDMLEDGDYLNPLTGEYDEATPDSPWDANFAAETYTDTAWPTPVEALGIDALDRELVDALLARGLATYQEAGGPLDWMVIPTDHIHQAVDVAREMGYPVEVRWKV